MSNKITLNAVNSLIAINIVVFIVTTTFASHSTILNMHDSLALYFPENDLFHLWQPFSYLFLHGNFAHILFNMYALFAFGGLLERHWGTKRFLVFYFLTGVGAALVYTLANYYQYTVMVNELSALGLKTDEIQMILSSRQVEERIISLMGEERLIEFYSLYHSSAVGASGAIYGILIAFAILYPQAKLFLLFLPFPISAKYFVPALISVDLFLGVTSYSIGNIAHFAHIGGAIFGLLIMLWWRFRAAKI